MLKVIVVFFLALVSCKEISYKEPQPKGKAILSNIPKELRGRYLIDEGNGSSTDTLVVTSTGYFIPSDSSKGDLSDSLVLKKYKGYYFFNDNENPEWLLRIIKRESNGNLSYMYMDNGGKAFNEFVFEVNKEIKIDSTDFNGETLYQIDPSPKQLLGLIKKGFFRKTITLKRLD